MGFEHSPSATGRSGAVLIYALTLLVAACSLLYELLLAQTLSALLGNTVLRYSITIGCYLGALGLGAMLCERRSVDLEKRLARVELALSLIGGLAVPTLYTLDMIQRWLYLGTGSLAGSVWPSILFLLLSHMIIVIIGVLSGFEVPLLIALGERARPGATNRVLAVDYLGSLFASVLFPLWMVRHLGLLASGVAVGLVNASVLLLVLVVWRAHTGTRLLAPAVGTFAALTLLGLNTHSLEQHFLHKLYFEGPRDDFFDLFKPHAGLSRVEHYRSTYQHIDLIRAPNPDQWVYDMLTDKRARQPSYPRDLWLYLDRHYQVFSGTDEFYHEWLVHAAIQARGSPPRRAVVLGGGDGLVAKTLLRYPDIEQVIQVELDPEMIRLSRQHPKLLRMNRGAPDDPRVRVVQSDAFQWLRHNRQRFDSVFIDMPYVRDYNLSLVYSREFYALARQHLTPDGFLAIEAPASWCGEFESLWPIYYSTLRAAGFATVLPYITQFDMQAPRLQRYLNAAADQRNSKTTEENRAALRGRLADTLPELPIQEFVLAFADERSISRRYRDMGVQTYAFDEHHYRLAFQPACVDDDAFTLELVNSIARPTLPPLQLVSMALP